MFTATLLPDGKYRYQASPSAEKGAKNNFNAIFSSSVVTIERAMNTVVIKTFSGMAQAACAAIDMMAFDTIIGTIAGEDTILVICSDVENAAKCADDFQAYIA